MAWCCERLATHYAHNVLDFMCWSDRPRTNGGVTMTAKTDEKLMTESNRGVQVSCTLTMDQNEALEEYRWNPAVRLTRTEVVRSAVDEFIVNHGLKVSE